MLSELLQPDTELSEHSARIEQRLEECSHRMQPEDIGDLLGPTGRELVSLTVKALGADSSCIWLVDAEHTRLIVSHVEPMDEQMYKREQPLDKGLVTLVLGSGQAICENRVYENDRYSDLADQAIGKITCSLMAVPLYVGGTLRGVVSCVKHKDSKSDPDPDGFSARNLGRLKRLSAAIERILNYRMLVAILGLEL